MIAVHRGNKPCLGEAVFIAENAMVVGRVSLADEVSVWYGCVLRGDVGEIEVGARTNIQDLTVVHMQSESADRVRIGNDVSIGHRCILHGCTIGDAALIGMGAIILDGAEIGEGAIVGAGAVVPPGKKIHPGAFALGAPARVLRAVTDDEREGMAKTVVGYVMLARTYSVS